MKQIAAFKLVAYAKSCIQPAYHYFQTKFDEELYLLLKQLIISFKLNDIKPTATDIKSLCAFIIIIRWTETSCD